MISLHYQSFLYSDHFGFSQFLSRKHSSQIQSICPKSKHILWRDDCVFVLTNMKWLKLTKNPFPSDCNCSYEIVKVCWNGCESHFRQWRKGRRFASDALELRIATVDGGTVTWSLHSIRPLLIINIGCAERRTVSVERFTCVGSWVSSLFVLSVGTRTHAIVSTPCSWGHDTGSENKPPKRRRLHDACCGCVWMCARDDVASRQQQHYVKMCSMHGSIVRLFRNVQQVRRK